MSREPKKSKYSSLKLLRAAANHPEFLIGSSKKSRTKFLKRVEKQIKSNQDE